MNFEEIIGTQILSLFAKFGVCEDLLAIDLFFTIQVVKYSVVVAILAGGFALVRRFKTPEKRTLGFVAIGAVFSNLMLLLLIIPDSKVGPLELLICFGLLNLMFVGIALLPKLFKKLKAEDQLEVKDLRQTEANAKRGALKCPGCGKKTISQFGILHVAQTCGECGQKYKLVIPIFVKILEPAIVVGSLGFAYYMVSRGGIQKSGAAVLLVIMAILCIPILKTKFGRLRSV